MATVPANSQVKIANLPSIEKSAWLMPAHCGTAIEYCSFIVTGSRKSSRFSASATMIADLPSGEKYMLYGSSTAIALPGFPVLGSIGRQAALGRVLGVVRHPQRAQVPRRHDVLRVEADLELVDDLERRRIDHVDVVRLDVRHVHARQVVRRAPGSPWRRWSRCTGSPDRRPAACRAPWRRPARRAAAPVAGACATSDENARPAIRAAD